MPSVIPLSPSSASSSSSIETSTCGMEREEDGWEVSDELMMLSTNCTPVGGGGWYDMSSCRSEDGGDCSLSGEGGIADTLDFSVSLSS